MTVSICSYPSTIQLSATNFVAGHHHNHREDEGALRFSKSLSARASSSSCLPQSSQFSLLNNKDMYAFE
ncbi:hypothetical protein HAX54_017513, partial [Datura stramonium]|nr:hypothetical protein [Datura stramonium]